MLSIVCGRILTKGGGQLVLNHTSSDDIAYLGGGAPCLIRGRRGNSSFETESA